MSICLTAFYHNGSEIPKEKSGTICCMSKKKTLLTGFAIFTGLIILAVIVWNIPGIQERYGWRLDFARAYVRGVINPVKPLPTPRVVYAASFPTETPQSTPVPTQEVDVLTPTSSSSPAPTPTITPTPTPLPPQVLLPEPEYVKQDINNCGPATLAMALKFYGWKGTQEDIAKEVKPMRDDRNVNVEELAQYVLHNVGWLRLQYRVGGNIDRLRQFIAAGIPVMIEETFMMEESYWPNDDRWAGHYLLLTGYDDEQKIFIAQDSFVSPNLRVGYSDLDKNWQSFNRVYIVLYYPEQEDTVKAILGEDWDLDKNRMNALKQAQYETQQEPSNAFAWFNVGTNLVYFDRYHEAAQAYDQARKIGLPQRMLRYQFGPFMAYFHDFRIDELMALTEYALKITPNSEEAMLWRGWGLYRLGKREEAYKMFLKALGEHPGYADAQYAIQYVTQN